VHGSEWNWGLYRNDRFEIAEFQRAAGRVHKALPIYCEVCYIDLNGPNNCGGLREWPDLLKKHPPFNPDPQGLAPAVVERLNSLATFIGLDLHQTKMQFIEIAQKVQQDIRTPLKPDEAWNQLEPMLSVGGTVE
jgi:hypothetical protein